MFSKKTAQKIVTLASLINSLLIMSAESALPPLVRGPNGIIAAYCGERRTKKVRIYPVVFTKDEKLISRLIYDSPVTNMHFDDKGNLYVHLEDGSKELIIVK